MRFTAVSPILLTDDVPRSAAWFRDALGFDIDFLHGDPVFYAAVSRGGIALHLRHVDRPWFAEAARSEDQLIAATVVVEDVTALHAEFAARGVVFSHPLTVQPWGGTDFHVTEPGGTAISFVTYGG